MAYDGEYGLSIDLGTSQITIHLVNIQHLNVIYEKIYENPQNFAGYDVLSRIRFALKNESNLKLITSSIRNSIYHCINEILDLNKITSKQIVSMVIVGNTTMHHFFYGLDCSSLLEPPYTISEVNAINTTSNELNFPFDKNIPIYSPPLIQSFIGADAIAVLIASGITDQKRPAMTIDVGTNTEIALWNGEQFKICSAASGSAFESMSLECGCAAVNGAIDKVEITNTELRPVIGVIGNSRPKCICGTGAISILSSMLKRGIIDSKGSIKREIDSPWISYSRNITSYTLVHAFDSDTGKSIYISQVDLRMLQKSKAAIRGGIDYLLNCASLSPHQIESIYLTGVFGTRINLNDAFRIGLFPDFSKAKILQAEHGASKGADMLLTNPSIRVDADLLVEMIEYIELIDNPDFHELYVQAQMFDNSI